MCGEPRVAAECTCTERESGRCSRPTVRPGSNVNDKHDHGDGSSTRPRGRWTSGSLTETRVRDSQYLPELFDGSADRTMNPCSLDGTDPQARHVLAACVEPDGPVDADGDQARVIDDARHPAFLSGGEAARPWDAATGALVRRPRRRRCSWPPLPRSPRRPSLASCRCRCRRPRTVCVVPRERWGALLHESSRAHTMPPDRILTCRCDMTRVGRGRSSDSGSHSRGRPHSPAQLDSGREDQLR